MYVCICISRIFTRANYEANNKTTNMKNNTKNCGIYGSFITFHGRLKKR